MVDTEMEEKLLYYSEEEGYGTSLYLLGDSFVLRQGVPGEQFPEEVFLSRDQAREIAKALKDYLT